LDIKEILHLMEEKMTQKEIADRLGTTLGQVKYQLVKYRRLAQTQTSQQSSDYDCSVVNQMEVKDIDILSNNYGEDRLVLVPRDMGSLYVYWEITEDRRQMIEEYFRCEWEILPKYLRVYDINCIDFNGDNANRFWDISLNNAADNWFIKDVPSNCTYCVDYGTTTIDGRFFTILRSNTVKTPPNEEHPWSGHYVEKIEVPDPNSKSEWLDQFTGYSLST
jgi:hypothetical protein